MRNDLNQMVLRRPVETAGACVKADVPTPDRGYWVKKEAGKDVEQRSLPERSPGMENDIHVAACRRTWYEERRNEPLEALPPVPEFATQLTLVQERIARIIGKVDTPRDVQYWQPAISRLLGNDEKRRAKQRASSYASFWDNPLFDTPFERRRLCILNSLGFALARLNSSLHISNDGRSIWFLIHQQQVSINLEYANAESRRSLAATASNPSIEERLELSLLRQGNSEDPKATWQDDDAGKLEFRLTEVAVQIGLAAEIQYREHAARNYQWLVERKARLEEEERKRKLEAERLGKERREKLEQARIDRLLRDARAFEQSCLIRKYVDAIRSTNTEIASSTHEQLERWSQWALAQAERIDPSLEDRYLAAMLDE